MKSKIEISITLFFKQDLTDEQIEDVIIETDYSFEHFFIQETRINGIIE